MASFWFLNLVFKCLHHFAWPVVALVYPMCASVEAIETDSYKETKHLISYWILLSLIYLFEYAFMNNLLLWFHLWRYIKLMIVFWLIIPDFGRASYVYNNLICNMKPQIVTCWRKCFVEKDNFLIHAERYMKQNGTEALEKLIASKNTMCRPDAEVSNEIKAAKNKEMLKITDANIEASQKVSSTIVETKGILGRDPTGGEITQSYTQKEVQKEWTCALCLVKTSSEITLISHLNGRKHREACEAAAAAAALKAKKQPATQRTNGERLQSENKDIKDLVAIEKKEIPATKQITYANIVESQTTSSTVVETKEVAGRDTTGGELPQSSSTLKEVQREWICALCLVKSSSEKDLNSHLNGRRHRDACEAAGLKVKKQPATQKNVLPEPFRMINSKLICKVCNVMLPSEDCMASHIKGVKHLSNMKG